MAGSPRESLCPLSGPFPCGPAGRRALAERGSPMALLEAHAVPPPVGGGSQRSPSVWQPGSSVLAVHCDSSVSPNHGSRAGVRPRAARSPLRGAARSARRCCSQSVTVRFPGHGAHTEQRSKVNEMKCMQVAGGRFTAYFPLQCAVIFVKEPLLKDHGNALLLPQIRKYFSYQYISETKV